MTMALALELPTLPADTPWWGVLLALVVVLAIPALPTVFFAWDKLQMRKRQKNGGAAVTAEALETALKPIVENAAGLRSDLVGHMGAEEEKHERTDVRLKALDKTCSKTAEDVSYIRGRLDEAAK